MAGWNRKAAGCRSSRRDADPMRLESSRGLRRWIEVRQTGEESPWSIARQCLVYLGNHSKPRFSRDKELCSEFMLRCSRGVCCTDTLQQLPRYRLVLPTNVIRCGEWKCAT